MDDAGLLILSSRSKNAKGKAVGAVHIKPKCINIFEQCCPKHSWVMWRERKQRDVAGVSCCRLYPVGGFIMFSPLVLYVPSLVSSNKLLTCLAVFVSISS